jgi:DNA-binding NarL/FixJ family response regulator
MMTQPGSVKEPAGVRDELQFLRTFRHAFEPAMQVFVPARQVLEPARQVLVPARERVAELRGAGMSLIATAAGYVLEHTTVPAAVPATVTVTEALPATVPAQQSASAAVGLPLAEPLAAPATTLTSVKLSPREQELVGLVARGYTDAQIAAELYITVRTVSSHLDRIRNKTGCRRRADLTRLAQSVGLV